MRVLFRSAERSRALVADTAPSAFQLVPLLVEKYQLPFVVSAAVTAIPVSAFALASVTLSRPPAAAGKSMRLDTSVPTAPVGTPASSSSANIAGDFVASRTGAEFGDAGV